MDAKFVALTGAGAAAEAMKQINPEVVPVYPITPQTPIVEYFAKMIADGKVDSEMVRVESEHSAMSATIGAQAAGVRAMTASSSAGLALMFEVLGVASGLRLPILMNIANRALSAPINIHCDHSDSMGVRDMGWIQIYSENAQEVYDHNFLALKLAEKVMLPAMVMQDGFITSHAMENVELTSDEKIQEFIGEYQPENPLLNVDKPVTVGALQLTDYYFETKRQQIEAMKTADEIYGDLASQLSDITGRSYPKLETYGLEDAETAVLTMSSTAGTAQAIAKKLQERKKMKVGVIKVRLFLPFPQKELQEVVKDLKSLAVLDRAVSFGSTAPLAKEVKNALFDAKERPQIQSYVFGLGGREIYEKDIAKVYNTLVKGDISQEVKYIGLRE
ncbi:MAG: transketolase C-terminal domain-containing protein [Patescibacteria group bacterium]|nr:transketolase C-terminal domain-containing protein [Patescibacteria group bacterium]